MIYVKVPEMNNEVVTKALAHNHKDPRGMDNLYQRLINRHKVSEWGNTERMHSLWELVNVNSYFEDLHKDDPSYEAYFDTLKEMLKDGGLITDSRAGFPMSQFKNRSIERFVAEAIKELHPNDTIKMHRTKGRNDNGIDFIWNGEKIDVKASWQPRFLSQLSNLGSIKDYALTDPTKHTDSIIWAGNMLDKGYISLIGMEKWSDIKKQIVNEDGWEIFNKESFKLDMFGKKIKDLNEDKRFPSQFLGDIPEAHKNRMIACQGVLYKPIEQTKESNLIDLLEKAKSISSQPISKLANKLAVNTSELRETLVSLQQELKNPNINDSEKDKVSKAIYNLLETQRKQREPAENTKTISISSQKREIKQGSKELSL